MTHRKMHQRTIYLTPTQHATLLALSQVTRVPFSEYIRAAIDHITDRVEQQINRGEVLTFPPKDNLP